MTNAIIDADAEQAKRDDIRARAQEAVIITEELKSFISEKIDDVTHYNCERCMEDCDECGLMDTMHNLKVAFGIDEEN
jgi:hypothetical protein